MKKKPTAAFDVVIVGGGMVGACLACALGDSGLKLAVLERTPVRPPPPEDYDLRVSAINLASRAIFEAVGAWEGMVHRHVSPVREIQIWDEGGSGSLHFDAADIGEPCLAYIIENSVTLSALLERMQQFTNVHHLCPVEITEMDVAADGANLLLEDGRRLQARLLVGADGAQSRVRQAAGIDTRRFSFDQQGIVATVDTEEPHRQIARQRFLPTGPLAFLPFNDPHLCSIVWSADNARAEELLALDDAGFIAELQQAFGGVLGKIQSVGPRAFFPLALSHAQNYIAERVALVGDAAHTVHPLAGQGVNLGFLDASTLAEVLLDAVEQKKNFWDLRVLRRYERWRKADNLAMLAVTGGFKQLFGNRLPVVSQLRNMGLNLTGAAQPIKNLIMRRASGLEGDLPKLARRAIG